MFSRYFESALSAEKNSLRNGCEVLRNIFVCFGPAEQRQDPPDNKLVSKLITTLIPYSSFLNQAMAPQVANNLPDRTKNNSKLQQLIFRTREFEARLRGRLLHGFCCLLTYLPRLDN